MTCNLKLDDAMRILEDLLNSSKAPIVIDAVKNINSIASKDTGSLE